MTRQRKWVGLTILLILTMALVMTSPAAAKTTTLTYSIFFPATHAQAEAGIQWAKEIEKRTDGQIKITVFPGGTLTKAKQVYDGVVKGISDIGMSLFAYTPGRFPVMEACDLPLGYPNGLVATRVVNQFVQTAKPAELNKVKLLYLHAHGPGLLHTKKAVQNLADLSKMKIRSTGLSAKIVAALGGVPVAMSQGAAYEALQKGVVEGSLGPIEVLKGWNQAEVIKYTTACHDVGYTTTMFVVMNKAKWDALSDNVKTIFTEISQDWVDVHGRAWDQADQTGLEFTKARGNQIITLAPEETALWKAAVQPVIQDYVTKASGNGINAVENVQMLQKLISTTATN